ncbi:MAG: methyltransferase regulatory domain-containing protein [Solirubrobacteraceae bacterium]
MRPAPPARCRVLELGCGDAGNLVPMALALPGASFVGVDAAPEAIARGQGLVAELGLENVTLEARAIEELSPPAGGFDYVIAHGVYSWVPAAVRDRLLAVCRQALDEAGVAYVSYNALPGGRLREALRDMLVFHTAELTDPRERAVQARALLRFLLEGSPGEHGLGALMRGQAERMLARSDATLLHDELAEVNDALYFHEFAAHAADHGLQYLAEADFFEMQIGAASEPAAQALLAVEDPVRREQYLDFLKARMFRQTLLCRAELTIDRTPHPEVLEGLAVSTQAQPQGDPGPGGAQAFAGPTGSTLTTDHPLVVDALKRAAGAWPAALWVRDLLGPQATPDDRRALCDALLRSYAANLVALHVDPPRPTTTPGEAPRASALARHQARAGQMVTNLRHASVRLEDDLGRRLVTLLDGTRDRAALAAELRTHLLDQGRPIPADLADSLDRSLQGLARLALLESPERAARVP